MSQTIAQEDPVVQQDGLSREEPLPSAAKDFPETVIEATPGWQAFNFKELWQYRELLYFLAWRDVKVRYKQTVLGAAWAILQPLLLMVVFSVFLGQLAKFSAGQTPYPLFAYAGLLLWVFFATAVGNASNSVVDSERLISKVYFPRLAIPFAAAGAALLDFVIASGLLIVLLIYYGVPVGWTWLFAPGIVILTGFAVLGTGTLLAALNVAYRDFRYVVPFLIQLWMFATPAIYMETGSETASTTATVLMHLNPLNGLVAFFRASLVGSPLPWSNLAVSAGISAVLFLLGVGYFRRVEDSFADII